MSIATAYVLTEADGTRSLSLYKNGTRTGRIVVPARVSGTDAEATRWATSMIEGLSFTVGEWTASPVDAGDLRADVDFDAAAWR